jgi:hypothetical protein
MGWKCGAAMIYDVARKTYLLPSTEEGEPGGFHALKPGL